MTRMTDRPNARELSESRYNAVIGLLLVWGFGLNALMIRAFAPSLLQFLLRNQESYTTVTIGFLVVYFLLCFAGNALLRSESPVTCFAGYNLIALPIGVVLTLVVVSIGDIYLVYRAALYTAVISLIMLIVSTAMPQFFENIGGGLGVALIATLIVDLGATLLFHQDLEIVDYIVIAIMAMYIGYDWTRANVVQRTATNAIAAASALYLDIVNIFIRILSILARNKRRD